VKDSTLQNIVPFANNFATPPGRDGKL